MSHCQPCAAELFTKQHTLLGLTVEAGCHAIFGLPRKSDRGNLLGFGWQKNVLLLFSYGFRGWLAAWFVNCMDLLQPAVKSC